MSEVEKLENEIEEIDQTVDEVEVSNEIEVEETNPIEDLLDYIQDKNYNQAEKQFTDLLDDRVQNVLNQTKVKIAGQIFNAQEEPEPETESENS